MTENPATGGPPKVTTVPIPSHAKIPFGRTKGVEVEVAAKRADKASAGIISAGRQEFGQMVDELGELLMKSINPITPEIREKVFDLANDVRGLAAMVEAPLIGEIADAMCKVIDLDADVSRDTGQLVMMMYFGIRKTFEASLKDRKFEYEAEIRRVLQDVRDKMLSDPSARGQVSR
jgi:hypothetical protein